jgi:hypothetical protein
MPLKIILGSFQIFSKIQGDIPKSMCTSVINDTWRKFATGTGTTGVVDTVGKFANGVNDTGSKFSTNVEDIVGTISD